MMAKCCTQTRDDHVQDMLGFMSIGVVVTKIVTFSYKMRACRPRPSSTRPGGLLLISVGQYSDVAGVLRCSQCRSVQGLCY